MNAGLGWALAVAGLAVGYLAWGWRGAVLALTVVVFWLLLQFSRALRALRRAAGSPIGHVPSAVMLNAQLREGMRLPQILALTRSLGRRAEDGVGEAWIWRDAGGAQVTAVMQRGRLQSWQLTRDASAPPEP
jgi:hypothetical protein